jgi:hypothetical protein
MARPGWKISITRWHRLRPRQRAFAQKATEIACHARGGISYGPLHAADMGGQDQAIHDEPQGRGLPDERRVLRAPAGAEVFATCSPIEDWGVSSVEEERRPCRTCGVR